MDIRDHYQKFGGDLERTKALSDGVFAIALTLLVLELRLPENLELSQVGPQLREQFPKFFSYLLSFYTIGLYWGAHTLFLKLVQRIDRTTSRVNLVALLFLSILPFPTSLIGRYGGSSVAWFLYAGNFVALGLGFHVLQQCLLRQESLDPSVPAGFLRYLRYRSLLVPGVFLLSILVACFDLEAAYYVPLLIPVVGRVLKWTHRRVVQSVEG